MKDTVQNEAEKEDDNEQQQDYDEQYDTVLKKKLLYKGICDNITLHIEMRTKVISLLKLEIY